MTAAFRCSAASQEAAEPLEGTASTVRAFLLVECPGPWGVDAVRDSRLPDPVKQRLAELEARHRVRPLLVRRHGRQAPGPTPGPSRVFVTYTGGGQPWLETVLLDDVHELLDLDLTGLGSGRSPGLARQEDPLLLTCTHGRHDACCAERGRPLCAALTEAAPRHSWEVSHIGGDRFASNLLVLPYGLYYGRLLPEDAAGFAEAHLSGRLDVEHLRGRSAYPFAVQAAEIHLRRHTDHDAIGPLWLEQQRREGPETSAVFALDGRRWKVRVHTERTEPRQLTCRAARPSAGLRHRLLGIEELGS